MRTLLFVLLLFSFPALSHAEGNKIMDDGKLRFVYTIDGIYKYSEFPSQILPLKTKASELDWKSYPDAKKVGVKLKEKLQEGLKEPPNLATKYTVIKEGCGSPCQHSWILNSETGKILGSITTSAGLQYKKDSELLIADLYGDPMNLYVAQSGTTAFIRYFRILDDTLVELGRINTMQIPTELEFPPYKN